MRRGRVVRRFDDRRFARGVDDAGAPGARFRSTGLPPLRDSSGVLAPHAAANSRTHTTGRTRRTSPTYPRRYRSASRPAARRDLRQPQRRSLLRRGVEPQGVAIAGDEDVDDWGPALPVTDFRASGHDDPGGPRPRQKRSQPSRSRRCRAPPRRMRAQRIARLRVRRGRRAGGRWRLDRRGGVRRDRVSLRISAARRARHVSSARRGTCARGCASTRRATAARRTALAAATGRTIARAALPTWLAVPADSNAPVACQQRGPASASPTRPGAAALAPTSNVDLRRAAVAASTEHVCRVSLSKPAAR